MGILWAAVPLTPEVERYRRATPTDEETARRAVEPYAGLDAEARLQALVATPGPLDAAYVAATLRAIIPDNDPRHAVLADLRRRFRARP